MKYRSRIDIAAEMLDAAKDGALKTRIMYNAFLSYPQLIHYLGLLMDNDLIHVHGNIYQTTEKGLHLLRMYKGLEHMLYLKSRTLEKGLIHALS